MKITPPRRVGQINFFLVITVGCIDLLLLRFCAITDSWLHKIMIAMIFSFTNNTMFSLLHEAVHGSLSSDPWLNKYLGIFCSGFFPTVYDFQKKVHLAHHKNNRTNLEQFDFIREKDIKWLKISQWYAILTGIYWFFPPLGVLLLATIPELIAAKFWTQSGAFSEQVGSVSMITPLQKMDITSLRWQAWWTIGFQVLILWMMNWHWQSWLLCFFLFGLNWSSLQYADHAWSPLDPVRGAWNLRVPRWVHGFFLNYHYHKVHHEFPSMSWMDLKNNVNPSDPQPSFFEVYFEMWKGPKPFNANYVYVCKNSRS